MSTHGKTSFLRLIVALACAGILTSQALAQTTPAATAPQPNQPAPRPPAVLVAHWRIIGIDAHVSVNARTGMAAAHTALANAAGAPQMLTAEANARGLNPTRNMRRITDKVRAGTVSPLPVPVVIEPSWCSVGDQYVIFVSVARSDNNELLGSAHVAMPRASTDARLSQGQNPFSEDIPNLFTRALTLARTRAAVTKTDALHVGLSPVIHERRHDSGASLCLNMLVEEQLAATFTIARSTGADLLGSIRTLYNQEARMRRPTRIFTMQWENSTKGRSTALPLALQLRVRIAEAVFGHSTPRGFTENVSVTAGNRQLNLELPPQLTAELEAERASLKLAEWPQVTKIYGAWVYLDRGRAWGLKMNDRMIANVNGEIIKGHVVRFYGPEQKLTSPRGFPVEEGAILYIRKGQKLPRTGVEFRFDTRQFPTTYPIPPGN